MNYISNAMFWVSNGLLVPVIKKVREVSATDKSKGQVLKKEEQEAQTPTDRKPAQLFLPIAFGVLVLLLIVFVIYRRQRAKRQ